eukprot:CAMPEP_0194223450 /NCGR_PEP_ID=MMETSP0156-20130528/35189_1 /TAXON_ID=33649 /ORGANISM="Thalassionema nitzschioides, Strain L26-B" /LENGTH=307 /DNA_ID=CAMNT_0038954617 /DNA_START=90 /DNA_END=1013 /DNA_ORIENTATION=-
MTVTVNHNSKECLYDIVEEGERVTISVFILSGAELKGGILLEGPVSPASIASGTELHEMVERDGRRAATKIEEDVNFEKMLQHQIDIAEEGVDDDQDLWMQLEDDDRISEAQIERQREDRRRRHQMAHQRAADARRRREERMKARNMVQDGEPVQRTLLAKSRGWYRACVKGNWYQISAELEMRKESDLGGIDPDTGHVNSYAKQEELEEKAFLEQDALADQQGIKDEDFVTTRYQLERLRHLLSEIQKKQATERHRIIVHAATNDHSHSRMVLNSLFQTIIFMAVTGFQVYTIRKWFSGDSTLLSR